MNKKVGENWRVNTLFLFTLFLSLAVLSRLFYIQILNHKGYEAQAEVQREVSSVVSAERGKIFLVDRFGVSTHLATNGNEYDIYAVPKSIEEKEDFATKVSALLEVDHDLLLKRISKKDDPYEPIKSSVPEEKKLELDALGLFGLGFELSQKRVYPNKNLASHISGFLSEKNIDGIGQYGVEEYYNKMLSGKDGFFSGQKDPFGLDISEELKGSYQPINGDLIFLSIDPNVQFKLEDELKIAVEKWAAVSGTAIVMESDSGRIIAMANYPDFDPNDYSSVDNISVFTNKAVSEQYEPGSVFKPVTMAIGIDNAVIGPNTTYEDVGFRSISGYTIKNYDEKIHGVNTMTQVLEKSLNTGTVFVQEKVPKETYLQYIKDFGFGVKLGIDLPAEASGNIRNLETNRDINYATASFGQGIASTPLQMISAISVIANGGSLVKPSVVDQIFHSDGSKEFKKKEVVRNVISEETAEKIQKMMVSVVENGFDKAKVPGYFIAGKTGTAQIPKTDGKGYSEDTNHSFVGFAPAYNARFTVLMKLEKPQDVRFASETLTMPFKNVMSYLLSYYEIPPDY